MENNNWKWYEENSSANTGSTAGNDQPSQQPNCYTQSVGAQQGPVNEYGANYAPQQPQYTAQPPVQPPVQPPYGENQPKHESKKRFGWGALIACMLVMALIAGLAGAGIASLMNDKADASDTPTQSADKGGVILDEDAVGGETAAPETTDGASSSSAGSAHAGASSGITLGSTWTAEDDITDMLQSCMSSVVGIDIISEVSGGSYWYGTSGSSEQTTGSGSGVIITPDGYIATCNHVVSGASKIIVYLQDGTEYEASVVGADTMTDLAVIKIDATGLPAASVGSSGDALIGDTVYAIGNPLGALASSVSDGIISGLDRLVTVEDVEMTLMQTNAAVNPGNSGGGLFNSRGELIGIVNAKATGENVEGIGFAIPLDSALPILSDLMDLGYVSGRPYLGITPQDVYLSSGSRNYFGYSNYETRAQVYAIESGSSAEKGGMQVGDVILTFDGKDVYGSSNLSEIMYEYSIGDTVIITVLRDNQQLSLTVTLGARES